MIGDNTDIENDVHAVLEPFDENRDVESYRVHLDHREIVAMAKHFGLPPSHLHQLAERMEEWTDRIGGVDRDGLYHLSTCNPDGRWDWYEIGGRWEGRFKGSNCIRATDLAKSKHLSDWLPYHLVTPEGLWLEHERHYLRSDELVSERMDADVWEETVRNELLDWPGYHVVCVDIHN